MQIVHRVGFSNRDRVESILDKLEVKYRTQDLPGVPAALVILDIAESDPHWEQVAKLIRSKGASDICNTIFTSEEILSAEWTRLIPTFEQGYPQPKKNMLWKKASYESKCAECGAGYRQRASFRLAKEPGLGRYHFVSLYWTYALFATPQVLETLEKHQIRGYEVWPAILDCTDQPSELVSQLGFPHIAEPGLLDKHQLDPVTCSHCGIVKYKPHRRGYMRLEQKAVASEVDFIQTYEWFGSGGAAFREILVSNRVARLFLDNDWRGVALKPVEIV